MHLFESTKGRGQEKNKREHAQETPAASDINHFSFRELYIITENCKSFREGSLTAVGPAGYNGGVHRFLNTAIPLNMVYKLTRLQKCIYSKYIMLFIVHLQVCICNCPCTSKALNSRTRRPGTIKYAAHFNPMKYSGRRQKKRHLFDLSTRDREILGGGFNSLQDKKDI